MPNNGTVRYTRLHRTLTEMVMLLPTLQFGSGAHLCAPSLEDTAALAGTWHAGQVDKAGQPYVGHLVRVSRHLLRLFPNASEAERHAAWLHDSLEDTEITENDMRLLGYSEEVIMIVKAVTKTGSGTSYAAFIDALATGDNFSAMRVKLADLSDNADPARLAILPTDRAAELGARYRSAIDRLTKALGAAL